VVSVEDEGGGCDEGCDEGCLLSLSLSSLSSAILVPPIIIITIIIITIIIITIIIIIIIIIVTILSFLLRSWRQRREPFILTGGMAGWKCVDEWPDKWQAYLSQLFPKAVTDFYPHNMLSEVLVLCCCCCCCMAVVLFYSFIHSFIQPKHRHQRH
jgi:hypothetical protein